MSFDDQRRFIKPEDVLVQDLDDEVVLLNLVNGQYYGMDEMSTQMFKMIISQSPITKIYEQLEREYDIDPEILKTDLETFLNHLIENDLVILVR